MAATYHQPRSAIDVRPLAASLSSAKTATLVDSREMKIVRLVLRAGAEVPTHTAPGELALMCLEGLLEFTAGGKTWEVPAGHLVHLGAGEPHALRAVEDSWALLTIVQPQGESRSSFDVVQEASEESFPASDPPARTPIVGP
jgi:quercetin dioxygenase-like cupin family protein